MFVSLLATCIFPSNRTDRPATEVALSLLTNCLDHSLGLWNGSIESRDSVLAVDVSKEEFCCGGGVVIVVWGPSGFEAGFVSAAVSLGAPIPLLSSVEISVL